MNGSKVSSRWLLVKASHSVVIVLATVSVVLLSRIPEGDAIMSMVSIWLSACVAAVSIVAMVVMLRANRSRNAVPFVSLAVLACCEFARQFTTSETARWALRSASLGFAAVVVISWLWDKRTRHR